jgi:hypothetical protein
MLEIIPTILNDLGKKIVVDAKKDTRKDTGRLQASIKYNVNKETLTLSQLEYGAFQEPNELEVSVDKIINQELASITEKITEELLKNIK